MPYISAANQPVFLYNYDSSPLTTIVVTNGDVDLSSFISFNATSIVDLPTVFRTSKKHNYVSLLWFISSGAIVLGHIVSVYIAHVTALRRVFDHRLALRGQYPMLVMMVFYMATGLWIIAQPIVER